MPKFASFDLSFEFYSAGTIDYLGINAVSPYTLSDAEYHDEAAEVFGPDGGWDAENGSGQRVSMLLGSNKDTRGMFTADTPPPIIFVSDFLPICP